MNADRLAQDLLGRSVGRRHEPQPGAGPIHGPLEAVELLRNAEVEQLHAPIRLDQDVRGLQVAMDDQMPVGVLHRLAHRTEEAQTLRHRGGVLLAELRQGDALDVLHDEPGSPVGEGAGIVQPRDRGMIELGERPLLAGEAFPAIR